MGTNAAGGLRINANTSGERPGPQFIGQDYNFGRTARGMRNEGERGRASCLRY